MYIQAGTLASYNRDQDLAELDRKASAERIGLWSSSNPIAPWDYHHRPRVASSASAESGAAWTYHGNVNSEDTNEVVVFDPKSLEVTQMVVMDAVSGKVIKSFPIGRGVDYAVFDPQAKLIFLSCGEGVLNIFHEKSADEYEDAGAVKTQPSAKTMAFDPKTGKIFLTAAEYLETPATTPNGRPQRSVKPGSFVVLVVSK